MRWIILTVFLAGCGPVTGLPFPRADQDASGKLPNVIEPADAGSDALPCTEQPCEPDDAGRCQRCPACGASVGDHCCADHTCQGAMLGCVESIGGESWVCVPASCFSADGSPEPIVATTDAGVPCQ
jgi:hypothetical protein